MGKENNNNIVEEKVEVANKVEKFKKQHKWLYGILIILLFFITFVIFFRNDILNVKSNISNSTRRLFSLKSKEDFYESVKTQQQIDLKNIQKLMSEVKTLRQEIDIANDSISYLQSRIDSFEKSLEEVNINPQRTELIKIAINIKNEIDNGKNYSHNLSILSSLSKGDVYLKERISILKQNQNILIKNNTIKNDFDVELRNFLKENNVLKENDDNFSNFLSNFIIVRKVKNIENNDYNYFILELENAINTRNYSIALEILKTSSYSNYFLKTKKNIANILLLDNAIEEIIKYLVNN